MARFVASRRAFLVGSTSLALLPLLSRWAMAEDKAQKGGRLVIAADSEPRNLNPAIVASNGVFSLQAR